MRIDVRSKIDQSLEILPSKSLKGRLDSWPLLDSTLVGLRRGYLEIDISQMLCITSQGFGYSRHALWIFSVYKRVDSFFLYAASDDQPPHLHSTGGRNVRYITDGPQRSLYSLPSSLTPRLGNIGYGPCVLPSHSNLPVDYWCRGRKHNLGYGGQ